MSPAASACSSADTIANAAARLSARSASARLPRVATAISLWTCVPGDCSARSFNQRMSAACFASSHARTRATAHNDSCTPSRSSSAGSTPSSDTTKPTTLAKLTPRHDSSDSRTATRRRVARRDERLPNLSNTCSIHVPNPSEAKNHQNRGRERNARTETSEPRTHNSTRSALGRHRDRQRSASP